MLRKNDLSLGLGHFCYILWISSSRSSSDMVRTSSSSAWVGTVLGGALCGRRFLRRCGGCHRRRRGLVGDGGRLAVAALLAGHQTGHPCRVPFLGDQGLRRGPRRFVVVFLVIAAARVAAADQEAQQEQHRHQQHRRRDGHIHGLDLADQRHRNGPGDLQRRYLGDGGRVDDLHRGDNTGIGRAIRSTWIWQR